MKSARISNGHRGGGGGGFSAHQRCTLQSNALRGGFSVVKEAMSKRPCHIKMAANWVSAPEGAVSVRTHARARAIQNETLHGK